MEPSEFAKRSLELLAPLGQVLYRAMEPSVEEARKYFEGGRIDSYVFADLARYQTVRRLETAVLPGGVEFERLPNNGISFVCCGAAVHVWKADEGGELRGPGNSKSKQQYFDQEFLLFEPDPSCAKFAIVWDYDFRTGLLTFSLACPESFDAYKPWNSPKCHFYIEFPHAATEIVPSHEFSEISSDSDIELKPKRKASVQQIRVKPE